MAVQQKHNHDRSLPPPPLANASNPEPLLDREKVSNVSLLAKNPLHAVVDAITSAEKF